MFFLSRPFKHEMSFGKVMGILLHEAEKMATHEH